MEYRVEIMPSALKLLDKIEVDYRKKLRDRIRLLKTDPRHMGSIKLSGAENTYRTRIGKYRIIYEICDSKVTVYVINIDHRKNIYR